MRFPHVRGGVSVPEIEIIYDQPFSPRTWGCFFLVCFSQAKNSVFPTYVGVFLKDFKNFDEMMGFTHVRGGVSKRIKAY